MTKIETNVVKPEIKFTENEKEYLLISEEYESKLDASVNSINDYMKNNNGKGKSDEEKDELYKNSQILWKDLAVLLRDTKYNFNLNRKQFNFLTDLILTKLEYDVNTVFFAIDLTGLLKDMKDRTDYTNDKDLISFPVNATEITYIYHLISTYKVKGLTNASYHFAQVLRRIGDISKVFNYYDAEVKGLSTEIQDWVTSFEDGVTVAEVVSEVEVVKATLSEPKAVKA